MLPVIKYDSLISIHITYIQFYYALYFTLERRRDEKKKSISFVLFHWWNNTILQTQRQINDTEWVFNLASPFPRLSKHDNKALVLIFPYNGTIPYNAPPPRTLITTPACPKFRISPSFVSLVLNTRWCTSRFENAPSFFKIRPIDHPSPSSFITRS